MGLRRPFGAGSCARAGYGDGHEVGHSTVLIIPQAEIKRSALRGNTAVAAIQRRHQRPVRSVLVREVRARIDCPEAGDAVPLSVGLKTGITRYTGACRRGFRIGRQEGEHLQVVAALRVHIPDGGIAVIRVRIIHQIRVIFVVVGDRFNHRQARAGDGQMLIRAAAPGGAAPETDAHRRGTDGGLCAQAQADLYPAVAFQRRGGIRHFCERNGRAVAGAPVTVGEFLIPAVLGQGSVVSVVLPGVDHARIIAGQVLAIVPAHAQRGRRTAGQGGGAGDGDGNRRGVAAAALHRGHALFRVGIGAAVVAERDPHHTIAVDLVRVSDADEFAAERPAVAGGVYVFFPIAGRTGGFGARPGVYRCTIDFTVGQAEISIVPADRQKGRFVARFVQVVPFDQHGRTLDGHRGRVRRGGAASCCCQCRYGQQADAHHQRQRQGQSLLQRCFHVAPPICSSLRTWVFRCFLSSFSSFSSRTCRR